MKIILEDEEIKEAIEKYISGKVVGNPEIIIVSKGDVEFEIFVTEIYQPPQP